MSRTDNELKVTDTETREWMDKLSAEDKSELKRQALLKRAIELSQPETAPDLNNDDEYLRAVRNMPWTSNG
jgi:hypothetical protein